MVILSELSALSNIGMTTMWKTHPALDFAFKIIHSFRMLFEHFEDIKQAYQYDQFQDLFRIEKMQKFAKISL